MYNQEPIMAPSTIGMTISCIVKSVRKLKSLMDRARSLMVEIFKILCSLDTLVFKNTKWPTCVFMLFVPKGTGHIFMDLGLVVDWQCDSQDSLQPFSRWITVPSVARLEA